MAPRGATWLAAFALLTLATPTSLGFDEFCEFDDPFCDDGGGGEGGGGGGGGGDEGGGCETPADRAAYPGSEPPVLLGEAGDGRVSLEWSFSHDGAMIEGFEIARRVSGEPECVLAMTPATSFIDATAPNGQSYTYRVRAEFRLPGGGPNHWSAFSAAVTMTPRAPPVPPSEPLDVRATGVSGAIRISWSAPTHGDIVEYTLYRGIEESTLSWLGVRVTGHVFEDRNIEPGITYHYQVAAITRSGVEGPNSGTARGVALEGPAGEEPLASEASIVPAQPDGEAGWFVTRPVVTLSASEGAELEYRFNGGDILAYVIPFGVPDGDHLLEYRALRGGEVASWHAVALRVDTRAPSDFEWHPSSAFPVEDVPFALTLKARDETSGLASLRGVILRDGIVVATLVALPEADGSRRAVWTPASAGIFDLELEALDAAGNAARMTGLKIPVEAKNATRDATGSNGTPGSGNGGSGQDPDGPGGNPSRGDDVENGSGGNATPHGLETRPTPLGAPLVFAGLLAAVFLARRR